MTLDRPLEPRKRPRQVRATATVSAVIEAAAHILEGQGLSAFNTNAVAAKAGVSIGSLYQYFPGKDAILAALIRRESEAFDRALGQALDRAEGLGDVRAVAQLAHAAVNHQTTRPRLARLLDLEEQRLGLGADVETASSRTTDAIARFLAARGLGGQGAAADILGLSRGMIDAARDQGRSDDLARRLSWAILGYLALSREPGTP